MSNLPFVSVIIVNFNGAAYLPACLEALKNQTYPADSYEVIVSDNNSTDDSLPLINRDYPCVKLMTNGTNLGFASGNNVAMEAARGSHYLLINNDTAAEPEWIEMMVKATQNDEKVGIVTGHLHLFYDQLTFRITCESFRPANDDRELGVKIFAIDSGVFRGVVQYLDGFFGWETDAFGRKYRWSKGEAEIGIPVPQENDHFDFIIKISAPRAGEAPVHCSILHDDSVLSEITLKGDEMTEWRIIIPRAIRTRALRVEQNTGTIVFQNGYARDRGTFIRDNEVFFEEDRGQYSKLEEVFAGCGANLLIKRDLVEQIGKFDDDFFMYYEDVDLCWRARLAGWKVFYAPDAIVRHIHCGTTVEWSQNFFYLTERNRVAMVIKNGSPAQILRVVGSYLKALLAPMIKACWSLVTGKPVWRQQGRMVQVQLKVAFTLIAWLPSLWKKRDIIRKHRVTPYKEIDSWLCRQAKSG